MKGHVGGGSCVCHARWYVHVKLIKPFSYVLNRIHIRLVLCAERLLEMDFLSCGYSAVGWGVT